MLACIAVCKSVLVNTDLTAIRQLGTAEYTG
jgi:hypothetical protein